MEQELPNIANTPKSVVLPTMALPRYYARKRRNKLIAIALMTIALLSLISIFGAYVSVRAEPLPKIEQAAKGQTLPPPGFLFAITGGPGDLALKKPLDVAIHPNGNIYVTTSTQKFGVGRIEVFQPNGTYMFSFDTIDKDQKLKAPNCIAASPSGDVYVSDKRLKTIFIFGANGTFKKRFVPDNNSDFAWVPMAMTFDSKGKLYVTDVGLIHRVLVFSKSGKLEREIGTMAMATKKGQFPGRFYFPNGVLVDRDGKIFVADSNNRRVQVFSSTGKFERIVETTGLPRGIAVDAKNRLYVVDALGHDVSVFKKGTKNGPVLTVFGGQGVQLGQMLYPNGLRLSGNQRRIFVADRENNRVDVFEWPESEVSLLEPAKKAIPLAGLLIPLGLLLGAIVGRRRRFFADRQFMSNIVRYNHLSDLQNNVKKVFVAPETYEYFKGYQEGDVKAADLMVRVNPDETAIKLNQKTHQLDEETAVIFAGAQRGITRPRILAETEAAHKAALELNMESMDHDLFAEFNNLPLKVKK